MKPTLRNVYVFGPLKINLRLKLLHPNKIDITYTESRGCHFKILYQVRTEVHLCFEYVIRTVRILLKIVKEWTLQQKLLHLANSLCLKRNIISLWLFKFVLYWTSARILLAVVQQQMKANGPEIPNSCNQETISSIYWIKKQDWGTSKQVLRYAKE